MKKTTLLFTSVLLIAIGVNLNAYSQPASRSVGQRAIPKVGRDRKIAKVVTPPEIAVIKNVVLVREWCPGHIVATMLDDGKIFVGWRIRNPADQLVGEGTFFTTSLQKSPTVYYTQGSTQNQKAKPFSDGRVLIASGGGYAIESSSFDCVHLRDNMVMIPLSVKKLGSTDRADRMGGYLVVR